MSTHHHRYLPLLSISITLLVTIGFTALGVYYINDYGLALFLLIPFLLGAGPALLYGSQKELSYKLARNMGFSALGIFTLMLVLLAMEGLLCISMVAPIAFLFSYVGIHLGHALARKMKSRSIGMFLILLAAFPLISYSEKDQEPELFSVTTRITIAASPETVWKTVIAFPELPPPREFMFRAGISYPISAKMEGRGVGAIRYCTFNTGSFVEPITAWEEGKRLAFDVQEQPLPMQELSFWKVDAPHLHDYFVSRKGEFRLTHLPDGHTLLEGTTWYQHRIKPAFYWKLWSNYIIHGIHQRVLKHIKVVSESRVG